MCLCVRKREAKQGMQTHRLCGVLGGRCAVRFGLLKKKTVETLGLHPMCCSSVSELNDLSSAQIGGALKK